MGLPTRSWRPCAPVGILPPPQSAHSLRHSYPRHRPATATSLRIIGEAARASAGSNATDAKPSSLDEAVREKLAWLVREKPVTAQLRGFAGLSTDGKKALLQRARAYHQRLEELAGHLGLSRDHLAAVGLIRGFGLQLPEHHTHWGDYVERVHALLAKLERLAGIEEQLIEPQMHSGSYPKYRLMLAVVRHCMASAVGAPCEEWEEVGRRVRALAQAAAAAVEAGDADSSADAEVFRRVEEEGRLHSEALETLQALGLE